MLAKPHWEGAVGIPPNIRFPSTPSKNYAGLDRSPLGRAPHLTARVAARCGSSPRSARLMQLHHAEMLRVGVSPAERIELRVTLAPGVVTSPMIQAGLRFLTRTWDRAATR